MKFAVKVWMKDSVLDTQGRAVHELLTRRDEPIQDVKIGKWIVVDVNLKDEKAAHAKAQELAETMLHNPLIEQFVVERLKD